jgi:hypothetical protein
MSDLAELLARVEAAQHGSLNLDVDVLDALVPAWVSEVSDELRFVTSSLDSAQALVERRQPDCFWQVGHDSDDPAWYRARILPALLTPVIEAEGATPALALLAALLKSLLANPATTSCEGE